MKRKKISETTRELIVVLAISWVVMCGLMAVYVWRTGGWL